MDTRIFPTAALLLGGVFAADTPAAAVPHAVTAPADTVKGCYVNGSGTIYRTNAPNAPAACTKSSHIPLSWPDGKGDDYARYLLADGVRTSTNGFAVFGTFGQGVVPASGPGARLMWYPGKAAFRVGLVNGTHWNDVNIGRWSHAIGTNAIASADNAVAIGNAANASGANALALGFITQASGDYSTTMGSRASANGKAGAFVYGDASAVTLVQAQADNQFVARAQRFWFGTNNNVTATANRFIETSTGAYLSTGGAWINSSDVNRKHAFGSVDADAVLAQVAALPITTWSYRDDASTVRHLGPMAQDFHRAFGLGDSDRSIATVDADGVALAAIQALDRRTRDLQEKSAEIGQLRLENAELRQRLERYRAETAAELDALLRRLAALENGR